MGDVFEYTSSDIFNKARGKCYLTSTFSPMMLGEAKRVRIREIQLGEAKSYLRANPEFISVVSHENTAEMLSRLLDIPIEFNRVSVQLAYCDMVVVICPQFRADQAREFTDEEISSVDVRAFVVRA